MRTIPDHYPSIFAQAEDNSWGYGKFRFYDENRDTIRYFNASCVNRRDGKWVIARKCVISSPNEPWGASSLVAFPWEKSTQPIHRVLKLKFKHQVEHQQYEDPRVFQDGDQTIVSACSFMYYGSPAAGWSGAHQVLAAFDKEWNCEFETHPPAGGNSSDIRATVARNEKNWLWFLHQNRLCLLYSCNKPWQVAIFGSTFSDMTLHEHDGLTWQYGTIRGGTPPVKVDNLYWTFFHSSLPWPFYTRRYFMGALAFKGDEAFRPILMTKSPLLRASDQEARREGSPLVVFPCGAIFDKGEWLITMGVNDTYSAWVRIPHRDVVTECSPI